MPAKRHFLMQILLIILVIATILLAGCGTKPTPESIATGKKLAYTRCTGCHGSQNFEKHRFSRTEWESVINRMMRHGAQFTPEEQGQIADFLSSKYGR